MSLIPVAQCEEDDALGVLSPLPEDVFGLICRMLPLASVLRLCAASHATATVACSRPWGTRVLEWPLDATLGTVRRDLALMLRAAPSQLDCVHALALKPSGSAALLESPHVVLQPLASLRLTNLASVTLHGAAVSDAALRAIEALPHLRHLDASHSTLSILMRASLTPVWAPTLRSLRLLHTRSNGILARWMGQSDGLPALTSFCGRLDEDDTAPLSRCAALKSLVLEGTIVGSLRGDAWRVISCRLEALALIACDLQCMETARGRAPLTPGPLWDLFQAATSLQALSIVAPRLRTYAVMHWQPASTLNRLDDAWYSSLVAVWPHTLRALELSPLTLMSDDALKRIITSTPTLEALWLHDAVALTDATLPALARLHLRALSVSRCRHLTLRPRNTPLAALFPRIERLALTGCVQLSPLALEDLAARSQTLRELRIGGCHRAAGAAAPTLQALRKRGVRVDYAPLPTTTLALTRVECGCEGVQRDDPEEDHASVCPVQPTLCALGCGSVLLGGVRATMHAMGGGEDRGEAVPPCPLASFSISGISSVRTTEDRCAAIEWWAERGGEEDATRDLRARERRRGEGAGLVAPSLFVPSYSSPAALTAAIESRLASLELGALRSHEAECALGCGFVARPQGATTAAGMAAAHVASGDCPLATFTCGACGADIPPSARRVRGEGATACTSPACDDVARVRRGVLVELGAAAVVERQRRTLRVA